MQSLEMKCSENIAHNVMPASPTTSKKICRPRNSQHDAYSRQKVFFHNEKISKEKQPEPWAVCGLQMYEPCFVLDHNSCQESFTNRLHNLQGSINERESCYSLESCLFRPNSDPLMLTWIWPHIAIHCTDTHLKHFRFPFTTCTSSNFYTGHAFGSWTHDTQKMWFQNRARIFIYG